MLRALRVIWVWAKCDIDKPDGQKMLDPVSVMKLCAKAIGEMEK